MSTPNYEFIATNNAGTELAVFANAKDRMWSRLLSRPGEAQFRIKQKDALAKDAYIQPGVMHLKIKRDGSLVWGGLIDRLTEGVYDIVVHASSYEKLLQFNITGYQAQYTDKRIGTEIVQPLWDAAKIASNSLLTNFTSTTIQNPYVSGTAEKYITGTVTFDYENLLSVYQKLTEIGQADWATSGNTNNVAFEITPNKVFNFYRNLGSNQNAVSWVLGGQIRDFSYVIDTNNLFNSVTGVGVGTGASLLTETESDASSQSTYGLRQIAEPFKDLEVSASLDPRTKAFLKGYKDPAIFLQANLEPGLIPFSGYALGDSVKINVSRGHTAVVDQWYRVIGLQVKILENGAEVITPLMNKQTN